MYIGKLTKLANKYNNTYQRTIKMNLADANSSIYLTCNNENNPKFKKDPKFKVGDHV